MPQAAVRSTAATVSANVCPRLMRCKVSSCGLYAVLHQQEGVPLQRFQVMQQRIGHAVGARTDYQPHYPIHAECLFVFPFQSFKFRIGIGISLEVGQVFHFGILAHKELLPLFELLTNRFLRFTVLGIKRLVVAIGTSTLSFGSITVGTSKTGVQGDFLNFIRKLIL